MYNSTQSLKNRHTYQCKCSSKVVWTMNTRRKRTRTHMLWILYIFVQLKSIPYTQTLICTNRQNENVVFELYKTDVFNFFFNFSVPLLSLSLSLSLFISFVCLNFILATYCAKATICTRKVSVYFDSTNTHCHPFTRTHACVCVCLMARSYRLFAGNRCSNVCVCM